MANLKFEALLDEARRRYPGERVWQCDRCGYAASFGSHEPPAATVHLGCGGLIRRPTARAKG